MSRFVKDLIDGNDLDFSAFGGNMYVNLSNKVVVSSVFNSYFSAYKRSKVTENIMTGSGNDIVIGSNRNNLISLGDGCDLAFGRCGDDFIDAGAGNDRAYGGRGNDRLRGEAGRDRLYGGSGNDVLDGGADNDILFGGRGDDTLFGGSGRDYLIGGSGDDTLVGSRGGDFLCGGRGADQFVFTSLNNSSTTEKDYIADFQVGVDKIFFRRFFPNPSDMDIISLDELTITPLKSNGSKVNISSNKSDFSFDLAFSGKNYNLTADDFIFATLETSETDTVIDTDIVVG